MNIPNWYDIYPRGTKQGDKEERVFKSLARHKKWKWRSVVALAKESNVPEEEVEKILDKYYKLKVVYQNPNSDTQWAYWTNVPEMISEKTDSVLDRDHKMRMKGSQDFIVINVDSKDDFEDIF
jgi:hypothetical protein